MDATYWDIALVLLVHALMLLIGLREGEKEWERQSRSDYEKQWF